MSVTLTPGQRRAAYWLVALSAAALLGALGVARPAAQPVFAQAPTADPLHWLAPCAKASEHRLLLPPLPTPTADPAASPTAAPAQPTSTPRPAPQADRVGFPTGYSENFRLMFVFDRPDNRQVRVICANELAAGVKPGQGFPYGSVLVMETWRALTDASGAIVRDQQGRFIRASLTGIFVMRKEKGFGEAYGPDRSGEWEYVAYRPNGSTLIAPANTNNCASCHRGQAGEDVDFVFRYELYFHPDKAFTPIDLGPNKVNLFLYSYFPARRTVRAGTAVTWVNNDEAEHNVVSEDGSFTSPNLKTVNVKPGDSFSIRYLTPGRYPYFCSIHPAMRGAIEVTP
jgi:hypothetical protein